ncbi:hypothetical protein [Nocardiopsis sp. HUAS JQ3]|uniref:DUF6924 domain-containing protein n=1 Tax=Nocardiopsis sp. HUAS JQ3 TaxID=3061629 RepID=UPI0023AA1189|nr:hypothetical protein [Nocardiopsis sp. HUAS JQ3]WDZ93373.1 hypothetical protein PV789_12915 [Nocardiopsis sp. HUAS JQ3]
MDRPALPLPPADDASHVPGMLLLRTDHDDEAWDDVLSRMGELPGLVAPAPGQEASEVSEAPVPRRLVVVDDPAWRGATPEEVVGALGRDGEWVPDVVLLANDRTMANAGPRPLLAFRGTGGEAFRITPRQAALTYLVMHCQDLDAVLDDFEDWAPAEPEWETEEDETVEDWEAGLPDPVGAHLEAQEAPPRYEPPARPLPPLTHANDGLLVRTDFTDEAAWTALLDTVYRPGPGYGNPIDDFGDHIGVVDDPVFEGATPEQLMSLVRADPEDPDEGAADALLVADRTAMSDPEHRLLVVPLEAHAGRTFRLVPEKAGLMLVNLAIANQDVEDYMDVEEKAHMHGWW